MLKKLKEENIFNSRKSESHCLHNSGPMIQQRQYNCNLTLDLNNAEVLMPWDQIPDGEQEIVI